MNADGMCRGFHKTLELLVQQNAYDGIPPKAYERARIELGKTVPVPMRLYRMDAASDASKLERRLQDIREGRLYLADASTLDDAHDAIPYISREHFIGRARSSIKGKNLRIAVAGMRQFLSDDEYDALLSQIGPEFDVSEEDVLRMADDLMANLEERLDAFRGGVRMACLTEDVVHQSIWSTYADKGNGIACEYSFAGTDDYEILPAGTQNAPVTLCPVEYSGRYEMGELAHVPFGSQAFIPYWTEATYLSLIAVASHKSGDWAYQREWRLVALAPSDCPDKLYVSLKPSAIYLGLRMGDSARERVITAAEAMGMPVYKASLSYESKGTELRFDRVL